MNRRRITSMVLAVAAAAALTLVAAPSGAATGSRSPNPSATLNVVNDVAAISTGDAWAVGWWEHNRTGIRGSLALRWDGARWTRIWTPNGVVGGTQLEAVSAVGTDDVWAVGVFHREVTGERDLPLAVHWDGAGWTRVRTPQPSEGALLEDVVAIGHDDVWAVGQTRSIPERTLTLHWNGRRWSRVWSPSSSTGERSWLYGVGATPSGDVWAVGGCDGAPYSLALRWTGTKWVRVSATFEKSGGALEQVDPITSTDAWAVGTYGFLRWNGTAWSPIGPETILHGIDSVPSGEAWAAGQGVILEWDGATWSSAWDAGSRPLGFDAVSATSKDDVWVAGWEYTYPGGVRRVVTVLMHWDGTGWSQT